MKSIKIIFYALFLFFVFYIPQLSFGQQNNPITGNQHITNTSKQQDLSGLYLSNNQDKYFLKQVGDSMVGRNK